MTSMLSGGDSHRDRFWSPRRCGICGESRGDMSKFLSLWLCRDCSAFLASPPIGHRMLACSCGYIFVPEYAAWFRPLPKGTDCPNCGEQLLAPEMKTWWQKERWYHLVKRLFRRE